MCESRVRETTMHHSDSELAPTPQQVVRDVISLTPVVALGATLDRPKTPSTGDALPPGWHWLYFWSIAAQSELGADGHPQKGGFLPDLGLPRRMAAGGRMTFVKPLQIGSNAERVSRVLSVNSKEGRSGRLAFVTVEHCINVDGETRIREEQDIVYREPAQPGQAQPAPAAAPSGEDWAYTVSPTETLLFRYSALTFNGHRIHYDHDYVRDVEGYPNLVVHGPLIATLILESVARYVPNAVIEQYAYKAIRPTFLGNAFTVCGRLSPDGKSVELWAKDHEDWLTMSAHAKLA